MKGVGAIAALLSLAACSPAWLLNVSSGGLPDSENTGLRYGEHPRQTYDLYLPDTLTDASPIIIFFYGGSWERGNRADYAFVGNGLAADGYMTVIADYRVYPEVTFPAFVEDGAAAVAHIHKTLGADRPTFVMGHSAGAQIAALVALDQQYLDRHGLRVCDAVQGFIGLAGPYDFLPLTRPTLFEVFPEATRDQSQPINFVTAQSPPTLLIHGEDDTTVLPRNSRRLAERLEQNGVTVETKFLKDVAHVRIVAALADLLKANVPVRPAIARFIDDVQSQAAGACS